MAQILLVEDDELVQMLMTKVLRRSGHELLTACSGEEALEISRSSEHDLGLVISDLVMPGLSGQEWVEEAGEALTDIPVIYMSGYSEEARAAQGLAMDEAEVLTKPVDIDELLNLVDRRMRKVR